MMKSFITFILGICIGVVIAIPSNDNTVRLIADPVYDITLSGSNPQIVHRYEEGDDIKPNLHTVYYYPKLDQYEVVVVMGKDR